MDSYRQARDIMQKFTIATQVSVGINSSAIQPHRYLWTDAFAVCNYLSLYRQSATPIFLQQALQLVSQVHQVLGQHRKDSAHNGWLSGLDDEQARLHPTLGGLRIGKALNERSKDDPINESLEWQQDGQYFHYLTKWMHALNCVSRDTGNAVYTQWAIELAKTAHRAFVYTPATGASKRMYWKMSIDLSRPLVSSMGQHDPLDGLLTYLQLQASAIQYPDIPAEFRLDTEIADMLDICSGKSWVSNDTLGIGGLLSDAYKLLQLNDKQHLHQHIKFKDLLDDIEQSLHVFVSHNPLQQGAAHRLAFRELGLAIGLQTIKKMQQWLKQNPGRFSQQTLLDDLLTKLSIFEPIHTTIENFWLSPKHRTHNSWLEHEDINNVMLATTLLPDGFLQLS
ncbi:hypothetical protein N9865_02745 [Paraglaciecola sp.]|nr:hypothetical protein [Paraglaciecola sp.]